MLIGLGFQRLVVPNTGLVVTRDAKTEYVSIVRLVSVNLVVVYE